MKSGFDSDIGSVDKLNTHGPSDGLMYFRSQCPLTSHGVYGLTENQNLRLCSSEETKSNVYLVSHLHRYHHLKWVVAYRLAKATLNKLDPLKTRVFSSETDVIDDRFDIIPCPLRKMKLANCKRKVSKYGLRKHLIKVHYLKLKTINEIVETIQNSCQSNEFDFISENEMETEVTQTI